MMWSSLVHGSAVEQACLHDAHIWQFFTHPVCTQLASGMLEAVEKLHRQGFVHRDIKPANFCLGYGQNTSTLYLVDFGFVQPLPQKARAILISLCSATVVSKFLPAASGPSST